MAKKTYVSPGIMLLEVPGGGGPGAGVGSPYDKDKDPSLGAKDGQLDDFEGFNDDEFTSQ